MKRLLDNLLQQTGMLPSARRALVFMLEHLFWGLAAGALFGGLTLVLDLGGIGTLIRASQTPVVPVFLLFFGLFITFGGIAMAVGVMSLGRERD